MDEQLKAILDSHRRWLKGEEGGERANLQGADLHRARLEGADLRRAHLEDANLQGAHLEGAYFDDGA